MGETEWENVAGTYRRHEKEEDEQTEIQVSKLNFDGRCDNGQSVNLRISYKNFQTNHLHFIFSKDATKILKNAEGMLALSVLLELGEGDEVALFSYHGNLRDGGWHYTHFTGYLLR